MVTSSSTGQFKYQPVPSANKQMAETATRPLFGYVTKSGGDQVHFGAGTNKKAKEDKETSSKSSGVAPKRPVGTEKAKVGKDEAPEKLAKKAKVETLTEELVDQPEKASEAKANGPKYGRFQNNAREAARIFLCDFAPLLMSIPVLGGVPGMMISLACMPLSYLGGKLGRHLAKDVDRDNLIPVFKYVSDVRSALFPSSKSSKDTPVVDRLNAAADNLLNSRSGAIKAMLLPLLKLDKDKGLGKLLTRFSIARAEVNIRLAKAENLQEAGKGAVRGLGDFALYSIMNKAGAVMEKAGKSSSAWMAPVRFVGFLLKNAAWVKMAIGGLISMLFGDSSAPKQKKVTA